MSQTLFFVVALALTTRVHGLGCLDNSGAAADTFISLKLPHGSEYALYSDSGGFKVTGALNQTGNPIGNTLKQLYSKSASGASDFGYVLYSDEMPNGTTVSDHAHMKGVLGFDSTGGFWLIHSTPRFPPVLKDTYAWPEDEDIYGQHYMCLTLSTDTFEKIGQLLLIDYPSVYDASIPDTLSHSVPSLVAVLQGQHNTSSTATSMSFSSKGFASSITAFAKNSQWNNALYEDLVEPYFKLGMQWETWQNGAGGKMPSCCTPKCQYDTYNNVGIKLDSGETWLEADDHSKWGISTDSSQPVVCIGDINRQTSQAQRGGGTYCLESDSVWKAFSDIITNKEPCSTL